jgi:hypothetical protein
MARTAGPLLLCALALMLLGCDAADAITAENIGAQAGALVEEHADDVAITWVVTDKGLVRGKLTRGGKLVEDDVKGALEVEPDGGDKKTHELDFDDGILAADIGPLEAAVTEVRYAVKIADEVVRGALSLPSSGTAGLIENAEKTAALATATGPNGGALQRVGDDLVEVVGKKDNGEVRVYLLDDALKPVDPGARKIRLIAANDEGRAIHLKRAEGELYFTGWVKLATHPVKLSVVIEHDHHTHVALCGHRPGHGVVVHDHHHAHPFVAVFVVDVWVHDHHDHHDHHGHHGPKHVVIDDHHDHDDHVKVHVKYKGKHKKHGHGHGDKIHIKID